MTATAGSKARKPAAKTSGLKKVAGQTAKKVKGKQAKLSLLDLAGSLTDKEADTLAARVAKSRGHPISTTG